MSNSDGMGLYTAAVVIACFAAGAYLQGQNAPNTIRCGVEVGTRFAQASKDPSQIDSVTFKSGICTVQDKSGITIDSFKLTQQPK